MYKINSSKNHLHGICYFFLLFFFTLNISFSQQSWIKTIGGALDDKAYAISVDKAGFIYITGFTTAAANNANMYTAKLNSENGQVVWSQPYPGSGNSDDKAYAITLDKQNNVIITGYSTGVGTHHDITIVKYNSSGVQQWQAVYNAPLNQDDEACSVVCDDSSNIYVTGFITNIGKDMYTLKYNRNGQYQWGHLFNGTGNGEDKAYAIAIDKSSNVYITGYVFDTLTGFDYATIKYNSNGAQQWVALYSGLGGGGEDKAYAIAIDNLGCIYVTGSSQGDSSSLDYATIKYDTLGNQIWAKRYNGIGNSEDKAYAIKLDNLNNPYITGSSRRDTSAGSEDFTTIKYNSITGDSVWVKRYFNQGAGMHIPYSINIPKNNSAVFVTGTSWSDSINGMDIATIKYSLDGDSLQVKRNSGPGHGDDAAYMVTSDTSGNIFLTGYETVSGNHTDIFVTKFLNGDMIKINSISTNVPKNFKLYQNYPNPFNPNTKIKFELPVSSFTNVKVYDILGKEVMTLVDKYLRAGVYEIDFNSVSLASGIYFYELTTTDYRNVKKMVLLK